MWESWSFNLSWSLNNQIYTLRLMSLLIYIIIYFELSYSTSRSSKLHNISIIYLFKYFWEHIKYYSIFIFFDFLNQFIVKKQWNKYDLGLITMQWTYFTLRRSLKCLIVVNALANLQKLLNLLLNSRSRRSIALILIHAFYVIIDRIV